MPRSPASVVFETDWLQGSDSELRAAHEKSHCSAAGENPAGTRTSFFHGPARRPGSGSWPVCGGKPDAASSERQPSARRPCSRSPRKGKRNSSSTSGGTTSRAHKGVFREEDISGARRARCVVQGLFFASRQRASWVDEDDDEDDDDWDFDGDADEDAMKTTKKEAPVMKATKSIIVMDIKPFDNETDLKALADQIKSKEWDGVVWGQYTLEDVAFGVQKIRMNIIVEDLKIRADDLEDYLTSFEDEVQSIDVVSWNKL
jgi:translation elongation factor EF-1beta